MALIAVLAAAGCASPPVLPPTPTVAVGSPSGSPTSPQPSAPESRTSVVRVDESLLEHLPEEIDGVPLEFSAEASADAAISLDLGGRAESVAYAVAGGVPRPDLAIVTVIGLTGDGLDEAAFRDLRDTYDQAVCRQSGGVAGNAQAEIDGRTVHIATCARDGRTYHALLDGADAVVSVYSAGEKRLGEQLMKELRDT